MKKLLVALLIALVLTVPGLADTPTAQNAPAAPDANAPDSAAFGIAPEEVLPESVAFDEALAGYAGTWVPFEDGFRLYLPETWRACEIAEDQAQAGLFYRAGGSCAEAGTMGVAVSYSGAGSLNTLEALARNFEALGCVNVRQLSLNGMDAVCFERPEQDYRGAAFFHPLWPEYVLAVYVTPIGAANAPENALGTAVLSSLSPWP